VFNRTNKSTIRSITGDIMFTNRQEELEARIEEAQAEIAAIEETKNASKKECKDCQEKLDAIPHADRKVTAILVHKDGTNTGGLMFHANGASSADVMEFGIQVLKATMQSLENEENAKLMFSLRLAMFMKDELK